MNEQQFSANLKAAFVAPEMPTHMDHKIDAAVGKFKSRKLIRRRLTLSMGVAAAVATGVFIFPAVQAQAALGGIIGALDKQTKARIITYSVNEQGKRTPVETAIIADGNVETMDSKNNVSNVQFDFKSYVWDPTIRKYIESPRRQSFGIKLSQILGQAGQFSLGKQVEIVRIEQNGREILRATVKNKDLPERYVIDADPKTQLPIHMQVESFEQGKWRIRQDVEIFYEANLSVKQPDFTKTPLLTKEERIVQMNKALTSKVLGLCTRNKRTVILRALDVAQDGTVFAMYQSGKQKSGSWNGYQLNLKDDLGTNYIRAGDILWNPESEGGKLADGVFELEVFVPVKPIPANTKRNLTVSVGVNEAGDIDKLFSYEDPVRGTAKIVVTDPGKPSQIKDFPRHGGKVNFVKIFDRAFGGASCSVTPTWGGFVASDIYNVPYTEIFKARWLAKHSMDTKQWADAEQHLNEELHWKRESEVQGFSSWEMDSTLKNLDLVHKHIRP